MKKQPIPTIAVRTVSETDDVHVIEGLGYPFRGRDTYRTFFSARTDFHWDLFPDVDPAATRADAEPGFVRPTTFHHGFDQEIGLTRIGGWSPVRMDADGIWVQAQIDKRNRYYATRIKPLLDAGALGLSGGSAEHSVRIDDRNGEVLEWPAYEMALTPVESNPLAQLAARAGELAANYITITTPKSEKPAPKPGSQPSVRVSAAAWDASAAAYVLSSLLDLLGEESDEDEQAGFLRDAIAAVQKFIDAEQAEVGTPEDVAETTAETTDIVETLTVTAWQSGVRAADLTRLRAALRTIDVIVGRTPSAADDQPETITVSVREDAPVIDVGAIVAARAEKVGLEAAQRLTG